jgi:Diguanylate cyclase, GGDEF domain
MAICAGTAQSAPLVSIGNFLSRVNLALRRIPSGAAVAVVTAGVAEAASPRGGTGKPASERVVQAVAEWVLGAAGPADSAVLMGAGEFAILCGGVRESAETDTIVRRIHDATARHFEGGAAPISVATAAGVAMSSSPGDSAQRLIGVAARAMRAARQWDAAEPTGPVQAGRAPASPASGLAPPGNGGRRAAAWPDSPTSAGSAGINVAEAIIHRLFGVGVALESAAMMADGGLAARIVQVTDELDAIIRDARTATFGTRLLTCTGAGEGSGGNWVRAAARR